MRPEHAEAQLEPIALGKISRVVAFPSLHNFKGTMISKICRNIKITDIEVHIVPFQTSFTSQGYSVRSFSAELTSAGVFVTMTVKSKQALFTGRSTESTFMACSQQS